MTKKLQELFDLPETDKTNAVDSQSEADNVPDTPAEIAQHAMQSLDKIEEALPAVKGLEAGDREMDDLARAARDSFDELMTLGMNVDSRYSSEIFSVASQMLGHAITAKNAKINKKLKMIELQLKKMRLDQTSGTEQPNETTAEGKMLDRNQLLAQLLDKDSKDNK